MDLTIREAATLLGRSCRTLRGQVARGDIPATKKGHQWLIPSHTLPLTQQQQAALQSKADTVRATVEGVLPPRLAAARGQRFRSVVDTEAFRKLRGVLVALGTDVADEATAQVRTAARRCVRRALLELATGVHEYSRDAKLAAWQQARVWLARAVGHLLSADSEPLTEPVLALVRTLEAEALPTLNGLIRWAERLPTRNR